MGPKLILLPELAKKLADEVGVEPAAAYALLEKESSGGHNVWGHDNVDTCGNYVKGAEVTEEDYLAYKRDRERCGMQGVGPLQLTWHSIQDDADDLGGCWVPEHNIRIGLEYFKAAVYSEGGSLRDAAGHYNGGPNWRNDPHAVDYANDFADKLAAWSPTPTPTPPPDKESPMGEAKKPPKQLTFWLSNRSDRNQPVTYAVLHESVGMTEALSLAKFCERAGVSYHAIADNDKIVYCVPRSSTAWHLRSGNPNADGLCLTTPLEGYSRAEWLGSQRNKVQYASWWLAIVCEDRELDILECSEQNVRDAIWNNDRLAGGVGTHALYTVATGDGTHMDPRNFPTDVCVQWAQEFAGYSDWQSRGSTTEPKPKPKPKTEWPKQYTVKKGDTLAIIAREFDTNWEVLAAANDISDPYVIHPGDVLTIPKPDPETPTVPPKPPPPENDPWEEYDITGPIKNYYYSMSAELREFLGDPVHPEWFTPDDEGSFVSFERYADTSMWAAIYTHPDTGTFETYGKIKSKWSQLGFETGELGYPMSGEYDAPESSDFDRVQLFQGGWIGHVFGEGSTAFYETEPPTAT